jgi:hypothetical protein
VVQFPNRYKLTPVSGDIYDLTPEPGIVTEPGTDLNKANLLKDTTAALYGLDTDAVPDDVFALIKPLLDGKAKLAAGTYVGTGTFGSENQNSLTFGFTPKIVIISGNSGATETKIIILPRTTHPICSFGTGTITTNLVSAIGATTTWYSTGNANVQGNANGVTYSYLALG